MYVAKGLIYDDGAEVGVSSPGGEYACESDSCEGERWRGAEYLKRWIFGCTAYFVNISGKRPALCRYGCRSRRHGVVCGRIEMSTHVNLVVSGDKGDKLWSD